MWILLWIVGITIIGPLSVLFVGFLNDNSFLSSIQITGFMILLSFSFLSLIFGTIYLISKMKERKIRRGLKFIWDEFGEYVPNPNYVPYENKPNLIIEFIKASYNKYCPKIDWK